MRSENRYTATLFTMLGLCALVVTPVAAATPDCVYVGPSTARNARPTAAHRSSRRPHPITTGPAAAVWGGGASSSELAVGPGKHPPVPAPRHGGFG